MTCGSLVNLLKGTMVIALLLLLAEIEPENVLLHTAALKEVLYIRSTHSICKRYWLTSETLHGISPSRPRHNTYTPQRPDTLNLHTQHQLQTHPSPRDKRSERFRAQHTHTHVRANQSDATLGFNDRV